MLPNTFTELLHLLNNKQTFEVSCLEKVEDLEAYPDKGMRLTITGGRHDHDGVIILNVSYEKYESYNEAFEKRNYYDKNHVACLNAREAGWYKVEDKLFVMDSDGPNTYFVELNDGANHWVREYLAYRQPNETYVAFLERLLDQAKDGFLEGKFYNY